MIDQFVGALRHCYRAFCVFSHRQARYAEVGRFLLQASGVCDCEGCASHKVHEVNVGYRLEQVDPVNGAEPVQKLEALQVLHRSWMSHKYQTEISGYLFQRVDDAAQLVSIIDVRRTMQRQDAILFGF